MSSPDHNDAGERWREDLPSNWLECDFHPPLEASGGADVDVHECEAATFLRLQDSGTRWIKAENRFVLSPEDYR